MLVARWPPRSNFDAPPVFRGRLRRDGGALLLTGTASEPLVVALLPIEFAGLALCGAFLLWFGIALPDPSDGNGVIPLVLGFVLTPVGAILLAGALRRRRRRFAGQIEELERGLRSYLRTGEAGQPL